jgi:hypothetical protein
MPDDTERFNAEYARTEWGVSRQRRAEKRRQEEDNQ